jgi:TrmH family RNA methyltransferase
MNVPKEIESRLRRVSSRQNALVKDLRKALSQGEPTTEGYLAVEGVRMIEEAIRSSLRFQAIFFSEAGSGQATRLLPQIGSQVEVLLLPDEVFASAVSTESPQGVAALVKLRPHKFEDLLEAGADSLLVGVAGIQDPGNLGTIIRSAEAFGARAVLLGEKTVSHFNPKAVRGSAGSIFREPLLSVKLAESNTALQQQGMRVLASYSHIG